MIAIIIILCIIGLLIFVAGSMYLQIKRNSEAAKFQNIFYVEKSKLIIKIITFIFFIAALVEIGVMQIQIGRSKSIYILTFIMATLGAIGIFTLNGGKLFVLNQKLKGNPKFQDEFVISRYERNIKYISYPFILATAMAFIIQQYIH